MTLLEPFVLIEYHLEYAAVLSGHLEQFLISLNPVGGSHDMNISDGILRSSFFFAAPSFTGNLNSLRL